MIQRVLFLSLLLALMLTAGGWFVFGASFAQSTFIGSLLSCGSFLLLNWDVHRLMRHVGGDQERSGILAGAEKVRFFIHFMARLIVLGLILFVLAAQITIDVLGLCLGLGTILLSVVLTGLGHKKMLDAEQSVRRM